MDDGQNVAVNKSGLYWGVGIACVIFLIVVGILVWYFIFRDTTETKTDNTSPINQTFIKLDPQHTQYISDFFKSDVNRALVDDKLPITYGDRPYDVLIYETNIPGKEINEETLHNDIRTIDGIKYIPKLFTYESSVNPGELRYYYGYTIILPNEKLLYTYMDNYYNIQNYGSYSF